MRKKIVLSSIAIILLMITALIVIDKMSDKNTMAIKSISIDHEIPLTLDFDGLDIKIQNWDKDYVEISSTPYFVKLNKKVSKPYTIITENNKISTASQQHKKITLLEIMPWLPLLQIGEYSRTDFSLFIENVHLIIQVPRNVPLDIHADSIYNSCENEILSMTHTR